MTWLDFSWEKNLVTHKIATSPPVFWDSLICVPWLDFFSLGGNNTGIMNEYYRHPRSSVNRYPWLIFLINTQLTLHWHLSWHSINTLSTSLLTVSWQSTNFWSMHMSWSTLSRLLTNCWSSVDQVSTKYRSGCWLITDWDVDQGYRLRVSIESQSVKPLAHMIPVFCTVILKVRFSLF